MAKSTRRQQRNLNHMSPTPPPPAAAAAAAEPTSWLTTTTPECDGGTGVIAVTWHNFPLSRHNHKTLTHFSLSLSLPCSASSYSSASSSSSILAKVSQSLPLHRFLPTLHCRRRPPARLPLWTFHFFSPPSLSCLSLSPFSRSSYLAQVFLLLPSFFFLLAPLLRLFRLLVRWNLRIEFILFNSITSSQISAAAATLETRRAKQGGGIRNRSKGEQSAVSNVKSLTFGG
jgi:hypothetical protein